jgi:hypothetical protein
MQRKEREGYAEKGKGGINGGRDMQRKEIYREGGAIEREGYAEKGKGGLKGGKGRLMAKVILGLENVVFILTFF